MQTRSRDGLGHISHTNGTGTGKLCSLCGGRGARTHTHSSLSTHNSPELLLAWHFPSNDVFSDRQRANATVYLSQSLRSTVTLCTYFASNINLNALNKTENNVERNNKQIKKKICTKWRGRRRLRRRRRGCHRRRGQQTKNQMASSYYALSPSIFGK